MTHKNCQHLLGQLSDYLDGEASAQVCHEIEQHLANCDDCRVVVDTLGKTIQLYEKLPQPELPNNIRQRLYKSLDLTSFLPDYE